MSAAAPLPWQARQWQVMGTAITRGQLSHALLLTGPVGVGKRHFASVLARSILCTRPGESGLACGACRSCTLFEAGTHPDFIQVEQEEGSKIVKVGDLREFNRKVFLTSQLGHGLVGMLDPIDELNRNSINALLKCLEEPPAGVHLILVGERWASLPATLRSRCVMLRFPLPSNTIVQDWLKTQVQPGSHTKTVWTRYAAESSQRLAWLTTLADVCNDKEDLTIVAERWQKLDAELPNLMNCLIECTALLIKLKSGLSIEEAAVPNDARKSMQCLSGLIPRNELNRLAVACLETQRLLQQTQAKPQMLLENLLASWYQGSSIGTKPKRRTA